MPVDLPNNATSEGVNPPPEANNAQPETGENLSTLKSEVVDLSDTEKLRYERAFGKTFALVDVPNLTKEELEDAKEKDPTIIKLLFIDKTAEPKFESRNNEHAEWHIGLRDLVDENVSEITLKIHPKNLEKGGNKTLLEKYDEAKNALETYKNDPSNITYFTRKSAQRDEQGNFSNSDGYFRIFSGDTWVVEKLKKDEAQDASSDNAAQGTIESSDGKVQDEPLEKPTSLTAALDTFDTDISTEMEKNGLPESLKGMLYALMWHESRWIPQAKNPDSSARGLGGMIDDTALAMHKLLLKDGRDVPASETEFLNKMKTDAQLQIMALTKLDRRMCERLKDLDPLLDPIANPSERNLAFLALAHHDGRRGIQAYVKWWQDQGRPEGIPEFPDEQTAQNFMIAKFQKERSFEGREGTNGLIKDSIELAQKAKEFNQEIAAVKQSRVSNT